MVDSALAVLKFQGQLGLPTHGSDRPCEPPKSLT